MPFINYAGCSPLPCLSLSVLFIFSQGHNAFIKFRPSVLASEMSPGGDPLSSCIAHHLSSPFVCALSTRFQFILNSIYD